MCKVDHCSDVLAILLEWYINRQAVLGIVCVVETIDFVDIQ